MFVSVIAFLLGGHYALSSWGGGRNIRAWPWKKRRIQDEAQIPQFFHERTNIAIALPQPLLLLLLRHRRE
ncbi:MAG: hypothetical protein IH888_12160 [Planctomycetes bacterium]|nr:hypothetical protein [Planctomycetota bacterium]